MKDVRAELVFGLIAAINTQSTGLTVYIKVPKDISYPFIYLSEITDIENGPKNQFFYEYEVTIELVYANLTDKQAMWTAVDLIKQIFDNDVPFSLTGNFAIMEATLIDTNETTDLMDSQEVDTTIIRVNFIIEDNN